MNPAKDCEKEFSDETSLIALGRSGGTGKIEFPIADTFVSCVSFPVLQIGKARKDTQ